MPASGTGTHVTVTVSNNSSIAWQWETQYWLDTETNGCGTVDVADQWIADGTNVVIEATACEHWHFSHWSGETNGCTFGSPITVPMTQARRIVANFAIDEHTLTVVSAHGGAHPGTETVDYGMFVEQWVTNSPVSGNSSSSSSVRIRAGTDMAALLGTSLRNFVPSRMRDTPCMPRTVSMA